MIEEIENYKKNSKEFGGIPAYLKDYETIYKGFDWQDARREIEYFEGGKINAAYNAIDRHMKGWRKNKIALIFESAAGTVEKYSYHDLKMLSDKFANALRNLGVKKGDRVFIFLPRCPEVYVCFLGILKLGAIGSTLFSAFGPEALRDRLANSGGRMVITNKELLPRVEEIKADVPELEHIMIVGKGNAANDGKPVVVKYEDEMKAASDRFEIEKMEPSDPAFLLYTSGSTGKPKGIVHVHGAIVQQHITTKWVLDIHDEDIYWCTADHGWVTGISYGILGPLSNGATIVMYDGRFSPEAWYDVIQQYKVTIWYTAPTAIRMLMKEGEELARKYDLSSLRLLHSVGEPLNPEAIRWGLLAFGLPFHDNYWQTETGSMIIANYPTMNIKLGSMGKPFPGIEAGIVNDEGKEEGINTEGNLAIKRGWPSMLKGVWNNEERYKQYFKGDWFISGDRALKDKDGYFFFIGRSDDIIKTSGERVGPFEIESVLVEHHAIAEAGVIGKPDPLRGEIIKAFVTLREGYKETPELVEDLKAFVKKKLAGHAYPREIAFVDSLPKTKSGKIMRRVLKAKEMGLPIGDTSTMES